MTPNESPAALLPTIDELTKRLGTADPVFAAWRDSVPDTHWVKLDLSALRIGYELGRAIASTAPGASESRGSVPAREPTHDMIEAGARSIRCDLDVGHTSQHRTAQRAARNAWVTMRDVLAATTTPPAVASVEPTAEQWKEAFGRWVKTDDHLQSVIVPDYAFSWIEQRARELARSAAAKGEG